MNGIILFRICCSSFKNSDIYVCLYVHRLGSSVSLEERRKFVYIFFTCDTQCCNGRLLLSTYVLTRCVCFPLSTTHLHEQSTPRNGRRRRSVLVGVRGSHARERDETPRFEIRERVSVCSCESYGEAACPCGLSVLHR